MHLQASAADEQDWLREALAEPVGRPQWRVWRYRAPAIVLGLSQRSMQASVAARAGETLPVLVRASGGGAVLAGPWMIGVTVLLPSRHRLAAGGLIDSYRWLGELHVRVLSDFGVEGRLLSPQQVRNGDPDVAGFAPLPWACFGALSPWELTDARGRKLCGLAQQRRAAGIALVGGTLLWQPPWSILCDALGRPDDLDALGGRTIDCERLAAPGEFRSDEGRRAAFASALAGVLDAALAQTLLEDGERQNDDPSSPLR
jgi:lipoate-protein ligase A